MRNKILKEEMLSAEQLEQVAGGSRIQTTLDTGFFKQLGYNMNKVSLENAFADNGVKFEENRGNNSYTFYVGGEWKKHPHFAALGYVLAKRNYPGFNGKWTDSRYVHSFLKENFNITNV